MITSPDTKRENRVPPGQHVIERWPVLHYGDIPKIERESWSFTISGLVDEERTLKIEDFFKLPKVEVFSDIHCVTKWSKLNNTWEGVNSSAIKELVTIPKEARFVMVQGMNGFTTNLSLEDFFLEDVLFATKHNGLDLTPEHGAPLRLVVPRLYFWKSAKWVTGVEFMSENKPGFWEKGGYHLHGDPWKEERYSNS